MKLKEPVTSFEKATHKEWAKTDVEKVKILGKFSPEDILELVQIKLFTIHIFL